MTSFVAGLLLGVAVALIAATNWRLRDLRPTFLQAQFVYDRRAFDAVVSRWTPAQMAAYRRWMRVDFATLAC